MIKYISGTAAALLLFATSCIGPDKIREEIMIRDFVGYTESGQYGRTILLDVDYGLGKNLSLKDGELTVRNGNRTFAKIFAEDVTVKKRSSGVVEMPMQVTMNSMAVISALFTKPRIEEMTVSGSVKIRYGGIGRKLKLSDVPLTEVLAALGIKEEAFFNLLQ